MAQEQTGRAVDRDELEVRLRPVHLAGIAEHELRDAIRAEHGTGRRGCLAAAIGDELRVGVQHGDQLLDVAGDAGVPEAPHDLLRFTARHGEARTRIAQPAARANGETEQRLYGLDAWRETPYYSARERASLEWTEALTLVSETRVPDDVYERVREQFSEDELVHLSLAIVSINGWNRLNIAARTVPGDYVAGSLAKLHAAS